MDAATSAHPLRLHCRQNRAPLSAGWLRRATALLVLAALLVATLTTTGCQRRLFTPDAAPPLGERIAGGAVLGRVVSPYTFEELEVIRSPVQSAEGGIMILSHLTRNLVQPGDYGYMVGDLAGHET